MLTRWYDWKLQQARGVGLDRLDAEAQRMRDVDDAIERLPPLMSATVRHMAAARDLRGARWHHLGGPAPHDAEGFLTTYPRHGVMRGNHRLTFAR